MGPTAAWRLRALGALSGALYVVCLPPWSVRRLAWVVLLPLVLAVRRAPRRRDAIWAGALASFVAALGGYSWIADTAHRFWHVPWIVAVLLLGLFATFAAGHFAVFATGLVLLWERLPRLPSAVVATLFVVCERFIFRIFPDKLGHAALDAGFIANAAALVGTQGLSFIMAWVAASIAALFEAMPATRRRRRSEFVLSIVAALALVAWGARWQTVVRQKSVAHELEVVLVQANIGDPEELAHSLGSVTGAIDSTLSTYIGLTARSLASARADLVVWPETAVPSLLRPRVTARVQSLAAAYGVPIIFGAYDSERSADNRWKMYNAAFYMGPRGQIVDHYYKHKLLLFGEYVPFSERFPVLLDILPTPGEFTPGPGPKIFRVGDVNLAPLICYELLFPNVVREALRAGGDVVLNLTNDYWFGRHQEPEQHLALCRMSAIETGRPIVRATNTGISALVDGTGALLVPTGVWEQSVLRARLQVPEMHWTPYARWGDAATGLFAGIAMLAAGLVWKFVSEGRRSTTP